MSSESPSPYIGLIIDYYPSNSRRLAAVVTEVFPSPSERPTITISVFDPQEDTPQTYEGVEPVDLLADEVEPDLAEKWGYAHEFNLQQNSQSIDHKGTETNEFVGEIPNPSNVS